VALVFLAAVGYFTMAAFPGPSAVPHGEQIEVRSYGSPLVMPDTGDSVMGHFKLVFWRLEHPRYARVIAAMGRAGRKSPNGLESPKQVFEEFGFGFPPGCYVRASVGGYVDVAHYPSTLAKMESAMGLQPAKVPVLMKANTAARAEPGIAPNAAEPHR